MRSLVNLRPVVAVLVLFAGLPAFSHAAVQNRITSAVQENTRVSLAHTVSPQAKLATDLGAAPADRQLSTMAVRFSMTDAQQAALTQLLSNQQNPASAQYHQWLTPQQFGAQFGLSAADVSTVSSWLTSKGFTITGVANSSTFITFSGTVAQAQQAFGTSIHTVSLNGEQHIANITEPTLPAAIAGVVNNITGLNDFRPKARVHRSQYSIDTVKPQYTLTSGNTVDHFIAPGDFYTIYDLNPLLTQSINGTGITIAVMGQVDLTTSDVAAFRTASGLSATLPTTKTYGPDPGAAHATCPTPTSTSPFCATNNDLDESLLDVEWSGAVAPSANIIFVNSQSVIGTSLVQAIDNNLAPIMTVSYGDCETKFAPNDITSLNQSFQQANAQGITITGPSGDLGATDCDYGVTVATQGLAVDFPASSPYVTGVGGTMFNEGSGSYWSATNGTNSGSALSYIPETVWNETTLDLSSTTNPGFGASGGGASVIFAKPSWQTGTGVPADFSRDVPDVSLSAGANHDGYLACAQGSCTNGGYFTTSGTSITADVFGGTSVSTPSFAGILALIEQKLGSKGLGNVNPTIYALANTSSYNSIFHDITNGNNNSPCTAGTTNCPNGGTIGYSAGTGYDLATGWGSVDGSVLANDWSSVTPVVSGAQALSLTTVKTTTSSVTAGTAIPLTLTVTSGTTSVTGTPTGTVQILLDGTAVASSSSQLSSGSASYSLATTGLAAGAHVVTAVYSGDSTFNSSKGTLSIDITSASAADFSLTPATATITVASGATSGGTTFTVTALNGFVGSIAFTSSGSINANYTVTPASVTLTSSTTSATTTYGIQASVTNARTGQIKLKLSSNQPPAGALSPKLHPSQSPWYAAGSGSVLACLLLVIVPRRRRWGALLVALLSVAALGVVGCSSSSSTSTTSTTTNTPTGTYTVTLTATGTPTGGAAIIHTSTITVVVQ